MEAECEGCKQWKEVDEVLFITDHWDHVIERHTTTDIAVRMCDECIARDVYPFD